jgi:Protein of unknown function (DUF1579)
LERLIDAMRLPLLFAIVTFTASVSAQEAARAVPTATVPALIREMAGTWRVEQRMWTSAGARPVVLPPAVARRRLLEGGFLEEIMEKPPGAEGDSFTRVAYLNFNALTRQFEYVSLDSRAPQLMVERSRAAESTKNASAGAVVLFGDVFVAPQWGDAKNAAFMYRLTIGPIERDRQVVGLYLTPLRAERSAEFLAFEYVYTRQR